MLHIGWGLIASVHGGQLWLGLEGGTAHLEVGPGTQVGSLDVLWVKPRWWLQDRSNNQQNIHTVTLTRYKVEIYSNLKFAHFSYEGVHKHILTGL